MATPPLTPPEQEALRLQEQIDELTRQWHELAQQASRRYVPGLGVVTPVSAGGFTLTPLDALPPPPQSISPSTTSVVPPWLSPILQGITILVVIGAALWVGQITGSIGTKVDNLQKSVDKINDWKDTASVSLGSLNTNVEGLTTSVDNLSKTKK